MATRSVTEVFILMRNNAMQNRHLFSEQVSRLLPATPESPDAQADDRMALVSKDPELGITSKSSRLPPEWVDGVEEIQFEISRIKMKMKDLAALHDKHMNRPTLDDSVEEEHAIEIQTQEITQMFMRCQRLVQQISAKGRLSNNQEQKLTVNISSSLARTLQELSTNFRKGQSAYLRKLKSREERYKQHFDTDLMSGVGFPIEDDTEELFDRGFTSGQLQMVEENSAVVQQREKEVAQIVRSIHDLHEIFKDLATFIVDQGTILDRIDYNIETTATHVEKGLGHLQKAEKYQKKNKKMMIILVLFVIVSVLLIILIATKAR